MQTKGSSLVEKTKVIPGTAYGSMRMTLRKAHAPRFNSLPSHSQDGTAVVHFLIPSWEFIPQYSALIR